MRMSIDTLTDLSVSALTKVGYSTAEAAIIADHLVDAAMRGQTHGGPSRIPLFAEQYRLRAAKTRPIALMSETPVSAMFDGGGNLGYLVGHRITQALLDKARHVGLGIVGCRDTYLTGNLCYYAEKIVDQGLVCIAASNGAPGVAPHGAADPLLGTNPIAVGFPGRKRPVIWDIGTSAITFGQILGHQREGRPLPAGVALDKAGDETVDPTEALEGAILAWAGSKGSGLAIVVQLLAALAGGAATTRSLDSLSMVMLAFRPDLLGPPEQFLDSVEELSESLRGLRKRPGHQAPRMPFQRSHEERERVRIEGLDIPEPVYRAFFELAGYDAAHG